MSFQHFRLGSQVNIHPLPPHLASLQTQQPQQLQLQHQPTPQGPQFQQALPQNISSTSPSASSSRAPYGSGDHDDGYSLIFPSLDEFHAWREQEEETQMVEFVKGDTHGSKAVPPRFKDHTKLVCARHSRSGRKKYVKKHPDRVRKVPSRKIEGQGCSASISFKTYFDTDEVRACYNSQHSHDIGLANLPFTRRGRKAAVQQEKSQTKRTKTSSTITSSPIASVGPVPVAAPTAYALPQPFPQPTAPTSYPQPQFGYPQQHSLGQQHASLVASQERWDRMSVLFDSIRTHARSIEYPGPSVAALESVLIRLYLESPVGGMGGPPGMPLPLPMPNGHSQMSLPQMVPQQNGNVSSNGNQIVGLPQNNGNGHGSATLDSNENTHGNGMDEDKDEDENGMTDDGE